MKIFGKFIGFILVSLLAGCASFTDLEPGTVLAVSGSPVLEREEVVVDTLPTEVTTAVDYLVGPGDVLLVNVNGKPDLSSPGLAGGGSSRVAGSRVDGSGFIRLPLVGSVAVSGLSLDQIEGRLRQAFSAYLQEPWVVVEIAEYKSHPLYLLGQFKSAGTYYMDRPLTLLNGLALGGGMLDTANLRSARLIRDGLTAPVDIYQLLREGSLEQNVWLKAGDTIYVPDDKNQNVFVFGAVSKPGPVPMPNGRLSLSQALASAGIGETRGNTEYVRIIRSLSATRGELMVVDQNRVMRGESLPFPLTEGDIVYVPRSAVGNWNQAIQEILPSLQAVSAVLQPFVSIKFLSED
ncbi:polysaccharide biosynthesis/export family protein [Desulfuromonas sp. KJ2020]|uniref:polysaccharide biosynthesis/export family protein n=1 Tax=Desulfuromonas sp. KJ2020 TaxID=2919173 RepID=UPI0020A71F5D|nr:polysaccharide biosynthesis/export family protein [Desulfuromonas sp. KJ2020]MCP3177482.1 polysaccharide biosynthesis/export family protein [Desulfuromonas sp. KJ2020]